MEMSAVDKRVRAYWEALGAFISQFAIVEATMQTLLWHLADVRFEIGKAVFSGVRTKEIIGHVTRIGVAEKWDDAKTASFKHVFAQLQAISDLRNDIIHFGASGWKDESAIVTNAYTALTKQRVKTTHVSPTLLQQMTTDLLKINSHLLVHLFGPSMPSHVRNAFQTQLDSPWQYKPVPQPPRKACPKKDARDPSPLVSNPPLKRARPPRP